MTEQVLDLIDAIQDGRTLDINSAFDSIMASKLSIAIDNRREEVASSLFADQQVTEEE